MFVPSSGSEIKWIQLIALELSTLVYLSPSVSITSPAYGVCWGLDPWFNVNMLDGTSELRCTHRNLWHQGSRTPHNLGGSTHYFIALFEAKESSHPSAGAKLVNQSWSNCYSFQKHEENLITWLFGQKWINMRASNSLTFQICGWPRMSLEKGTIDEKVRETSISHVRHLHHV